MAGLIGLLVGGVLIVYIISALIERFVVSQIMDDPAAGMVVSTVLAVIVAIVFYGFGNANGGPWNPLPGAFAYITAGVILAILRLIGLRRKAAREAEEADLDQIFE